MNEHADAMAVGAMAPVLPAEPAVRRRVASSREQAPPRPRERAYLLIWALWGADLFFACASVFAGLGIRAWHRGAGDHFLAALHHISSAPMLWIFAGGALYSWLMIAMRTYEVENFARFHVWARNVVKASLLWIAIMLSAVVLLSPDGFAPRAGLIYCVAALLIVQTSWRLFAFMFLRQPHVRESASSRIIVVGWTDRASQLGEALEQDEAKLARVIGCVPCPGVGLANPPPDNVPILGSYARLPELVRAHGANAVILSESCCSAEEIRRLIEFCQRELLSFQMVPEYFPALGSGLQVENISGVPLLGVTHLPLDSTVNRLIKRTFDLVGASIGLVLSLPIILLFGALVFLESPGPVFYRQRRTSRGGRDFYIYKIRSMRPDAESNSGAVWCKRDDPRRLRVGAFMRRWNIDELPQFWNVLKGDMSLVGPRPERPELIRRFKDEIPNYNARHEVSAGLTGWAQIHGYRGDTDLRKRIEYDLYYLENWSPLLDLYCVAATFFRNRNAH